MATGDYQQFFDDLLTSIGLGNLSPAQRAADERALAAVAQFEGLNDRFNPLNSVIPYGSSTPFNSVGVQDYKNWRQGVVGEQLLLTGPNHSSVWDPVDAALRSGNEGQVISAFDRAYQSWGSSGPPGISAAQANAILATPLGSRQPVPIVSGLDPKSLKAPLTKAQRAQILDWLAAHHVPGARTFFAHESDGALIEIYKQMYYADAHSGAPLSPISGLGFKIKNPFSFDWVKTLVIKGTFTMAGLGLAVLGMYAAAHRPEAAS